VTGVVWALVSFCGAGDVTLYAHRVNAVEMLALINGSGCGKGCKRQHSLVRWEGER